MGDAYFYIVTAEKDWGKYLVEGKTTREEVQRVVYSQSLQKACFSHLKVPQKVR